MKTLLTELIPITVRDFLSDSKNKRLLLDNSKQGTYGQLFLAELDKIIAINIAVESASWTNHGKRFNVSKDEPTKLYWGYGISLIYHSGKNNGTHSYCTDVKPLLVWLPDFNCFCTYDHEHQEVIAFPNNTLTDFVMEPEKFVCPWDYLSDAQLLEAQLPFQEKWSFENQ